MNTKIIKIDPKNIDMGILKEAGQMIREGKLVAFPTETVYGLGADALNDDAVAKIFKAKGRPYNDPLIVHICCLADVNRFVDDIPGIAINLGRYFWPGPLTLIMKRSKAISDFVTSGLDTVAIRIPSHPVAQVLIQEAQRPIAAPSANLFTHTSPTSAKHVIDDLQGKIDMIIDSGEATIGVESTIVDVTELPLKVLRLGGITFEKLKEVTPEIIIANEDDHLKKAPGMFKKHYSPKAKMIVVEEKNDEMVTSVLRLASNFRDLGSRVGIIASKENAKKYFGFQVKVLGEARDLETCARNLYAQMRILDDLQCDIIVSENFENRGLGRAIMDRLHRASG
ncbi:MAG: threonylcarbamoyl-AMP synthase [Candidatus Atribacteria bacterium]|nr:threonylcarbamoyl-AMP synthase [Candidatus Atribacteria bacterium]